MARLLEVGLHHRVRQRIRDDVRVGQWGGRDMVVGDLDLGPTDADQLVVLEDGVRVRVADLLLHIGVQRGDVVLEVTPRSQRRRCPLIRTTWID